MSCLRYLPSRRFFAAKNYTTLFSGYVQDWENKLESTSSINTWSYSRGSIPFGVTSVSYYDEDENWGSLVSIYGGVNLFEKRKVGSDINKNESHPLRFTVNALAMYKLDLSDSLDLEFGLGFGYTFFKYDYSSWYLKRHIFTGNAQVGCLWNITDDMVLRSGVQVDIPLWSKLDWGSSTTASIKQGCMLMPYVGFGFQF